MNNINEKTTTPIGCMAALLAEMTERAMEAERQRDAAKDESDQWYRHYQNLEAKLKDAEASLAAQIKENEVLREAIAEYIESMHNEAPEQGGPANA